MKTILVIDDSPSQLFLHRIVLEGGGYEVHTAQNASEALAVLSRIGIPDLILLDVRMGDISGSELLEELEKERADIVENVPVVFHSAMDEAPSSKAAGFIRKGLDIDDFLKAVHRYIEMGMGQHARVQNQ